MSIFDDLLGIKRDHPRECTCAQPYQCIHPLPCPVHGYRRQSWEIYNPPITWNITTTTTTTEETTTKPKKPSGPAMRPEDV